MTNIDTKNYNKPVESQYLHMFMEEGILVCIIKKMDTLDLATTRICVQQRKEFIGGKSYPTIFDITQVRHSTKEARDFLANEGNELVSASAILVSSPMLRMMANFFIMVNKPQNPTRMFTDKKSALEWLRQFT
jgi:hypothetical protein